MGDRVSGAAAEEERVFLLGKEFGEDINALFHEGGKQPFYLIVQIFQYDMPAWLCYPA